jgi:hypothetical protein
VECEVRLKESQTVVGTVDEFCGTKKQVEEKEEALATDYYCINCNVTTGFGTVSSGIVCGERTFIDSVENAYRTGALANGNPYDCTYYRDTVNVTCLLKQ